MRLNLKRKSEIAIGLISLIFFSVLLFSPIKSKPFGDGDFHNETKILAAYIWGETPYSQLSITKAPGPVLYYLFPYTICGPMASDLTLWRVSTAWTAIIVTITLILLFSAIERCFNFRVAILFIGLTFILPLYIYYSMGVLAESLAFLGVCWMLIGFLRRDKRKKFYIFFVIGIASLVLARPNAGLVIPLLVVSSLFLLWKFHDKIAIQVLKATVIAFVCIVAIFLIVKSLPNTRATLKQEEYLSFVMHHGRFQFRTETFDWRFWDDKTRPDSKDYQAWQKSTWDLNQQMKEQSLSYKEVYFNWVIQDILSNPLTVVKQFFVRLLFGNTLQISSRSPEEFSIGGVKGSSVYWTIHILLNILNYSILFFALYYLIKQKGWREFWPVIAVILALWLFHGFIYIEQRYLFPVRPVILLLASLGAISFFKLDHTNATT